MARVDFFLVFLVLWTGESCTLAKWSARSDRAIFSLQTGHSSESFVLTGVGDSGTSWLLSGVGPALSIRLSLSVFRLWISFLSPSDSLWTLRRCLAILALYMTLPQTLQVPWRFGVASDSLDWGDSVQANSGLTDKDRGKGVVDLELDLLLLPERRPFVTEVFFFFLLGIINSLGSSSESLASLVSGVMGGASTESLSALLAITSSMAGVSSDGVRSTSAQRILAAAFFCWKAASWSRQDNPSRAFSCSARAFNSLSISGVGFIKACACLSR